MSSLAALGAGALTLASPLAAQDAAGSQPAPMKCERGPVERYFDNVQWYVFACEDGASLVFFTISSMTASDFRALHSEASAQGR